MGLPGAKPPHFAHVFGHVDAVLLVVGAFHGERVERARIVDIVEDGGHVEVGAREIAYGGGGERDAPVFHVFDAVGGRDAVAYAGGVLRFRDDHVDVGRVEFLEPPVVGGSRLHGQHERDVHDACGDCDDDAEGRVLPFGFFKVVEARACDHHSICVRNSSNLAVRAASSRYGPSSHEPKICPSRT